MERSEVAGWRPRKSGEFIGAATVRLVRRLQDEIRQGTWAGPVALVAPPGLGKTSLARHLGRCLCCPSFLGGGEPCGRCEGCRSQCPEFSGEVHGYWHGEYDGSELDRKDLIRLFRRAREMDRAVLFLDEFAALPADARRVVTKFAEEFRGVLLCAVTTGNAAEGLEDSVGKPLAERFREYRLRRPAADEVAQSLAALAPGWGIRVALPTLRLLVPATGQSLRRCLRILARVPRGGELTHRNIQDELGLEDGWEEDFGFPATS